MRAAIHRYKYENQPELAVPLTRYLLAAFAGDEWAAAREAIDVVIPVPLHPDRFAERGYNQSELLAAEFCRHTKISMQPDWIVRTRQTRPQVGLTATERTENVQSAFVAGPWSAERNILLIDDVFTTGATMQACAMAAKNVGANAVFGLTLAMPMA
jgi:ComF family protein